MRLSTKSKYAMSAMIELAARETNDGPVRLADISRHQGISVSYLEQLFSRLRKSGLVIGARGPGGGYRLGRMPNDISVADVLVAIDTNSMVQNQSDVWHWQHPGRNLPNTLWRDLSWQLYDFLKGISLAEVVAQDSVQTALANPIPASTTGMTADKESYAAH